MRHLRGLNVTSEAGTELVDLQQACSTEWGNGCAQGSRTGDMLLFMGWVRI